VVHTVALDLDWTWIGDLAIHVSHFGFYARIHIWLKIDDGTRS
jgi:hypothetical protein